MSARETILQNFWLKFFSFVLATMIWFAIYGSQNAPRTERPALGTMVRKLERVPITVLTPAADLRAYQVEPSQIDVTVRGAIAEVQALTAQQLEVFINLADLRDMAGLTKKILVHPPAGITVVEVSHKEAHVRPSVTAP